MDPFLLLIMRHNPSDYFKSLAYDEQWIKELERNRFYHIQKIKKENKHVIIFKENRDEVSDNDIARLSMTEV